MEGNMESEVSSPPRDSTKCYDCSCTTSPPSTWFQPVKRKYDECENRNGLHVPGFDHYSNARVQMVNECAALREIVSSQQAAIENLYAELEEERNASSSAATEAMSMILKLQREKAETQMDARQFKRLAEEKMAHDQQEIMVLEDLLYRRERAIQAHTCEALSYKHRMMGYGLTEAEAEGDNDSQIWNLGVAENFGAQLSLPACDYPPLKCNLNESPGVGGEDVEKYAFIETPCSRELLRNLERRIGRMEKNPGSSLSQLDEDFHVTENVTEKMIVAHSPKQPRCSRTLSTDSSNSVLDKEMSLDFTSVSPRFNTSFKTTDDFSSSRRMDNASAVGDDMSDRVYMIGSVFNGVPHNKTTEPDPGGGICDDHASTPRETFNLPDIRDPDIKKLYARLLALEADRESMRQMIILMQTDKEQVVLLKEIAQHLCKEMSPERQVDVRKPSILGSLPFIPVLKWIVSFVSYRRKVHRNKYLNGLSPYNVGLLMLLDKDLRLRQWRCVSRTQV